MQKNVPFEVTISLKATMFGQSSAFRIFTSRIAVIGNPFSSCSVLIRFKATIFPVTLSAPTKTLLRSKEHAEIAGDIQSDRVRRKVWRKSNNKQAFLDPTREDSISLVGSGLQATQTATKTHFSIINVPVSPLANLMFLCIYSHIS